MSQEITQLHNEVLEFLLEKRKENEELYFTLRATDSEKLRLGYWFWGNDDTHLYFSFWQGTVKGVPSVCFRIDIEGTLILFLYAENNEKSYSFFEKVAKILGNFKQIQVVKLMEYLPPIKKNQEQDNYVDKQEPYWQRIYTKGTWEESLNKFIATEKQKVDILLDFMENKEVGNFKAIQKEDFEKDLQQINNIQITLQKNQKKVYLPLQLQRLTLKNIGHFENITLDLSKKVTVLIGENGSGKSTILRAISLGITGTDVFDLDTEVKRIKNWVLADFLRIVQYEKGEMIYSNEGEINLTINEETLQIILRPSALYKGTVNGEAGSGDRNVILNRKKFLNTLVIAFVQDANKYNPIMADIIDVNPIVSDLLPMILKVGQDIMKSLTNWLYYYVHEKNASKPIEKLFAIFSKIIGEEITLKQPYKTEGVVGSALGEVTIVITTPQNPEGINLDLVSQGYNNLFRWVGGILMRVYEYQQNFFPEKSLEEISGIVLIDEIDTYLHPKWQRNILKVLVEEFPNLQFVVTTHSPLVIGHLALWKNSNVFKIQNNDVVPKTHFYGRNPIDLLLEFYGVETRPKEIQEKIDNLYYAFEGENLYEAKQILAELTEILGADDAIISEFTTSITLLEEIQ